MTVFAGDQVQSFVRLGTFRSLTLTLLIVYCSFAGWPEVTILLLHCLWSYRSIVLGWLTDERILIAGPMTCAVVIAVIYLSARVALFSPWSGPARPYLIPSRTTHTRLFPKKHSFSYSYLTVGVPVGLQGCINGLLSSDSRHDSATWLSRLFGLSRGWFDVDSDDYLARGSCEGGLRAKLDNYLTSQGIKPTDYPHAYLITAARFLGYSFNPVSFWYLYSPDKILSAIILEVNNTFDERRAYFVQRDLRNEKKLVIRKNQEAESRVRIENSWAKDFHVSPFNSRKGSYSLRACDPLGPSMQGFRGLEVTIHLSSSKGHPKLVARLFHVGNAVDPEEMGAVQKLSFIGSWFWVGFLTFPRIVKEAAVLFFKKRLHVWYRPEPLKESLGRHADSTETELERVFRQYLRHLVEKSPHSLVVRYIPSGIPGGLGEEMMTSDKAATAPPEEHPETLELRVLTPAFYSRFVHYAHDFEAVFCEMLENKTLWVDKPALLPHVFLKKASPPLNAGGIADYVWFKLIQRLRKRPEKIVRPLTSADKPVDTPTYQVDVRGFRISSMDAFVLQQADPKLRSKYRAILTQLFLANRLFPANPEIFNLVLYGIRVGLAWLLASTAVRWLDSDL